MDLQPAPSLPWSWSHQPSYSPAVGPLQQPQRPLTGRVLHVINGEYYSGAERVQDLLALRLPGQGFEVGFACVKPGRFPQARVSDVPLFEAPMKNRLDVTAAWTIARLVRREDYTLLHAHTPRSALVAEAAARLTGLPWVYHVHSPASRDSTQIWRNWLNAVNERWSLRGAAGLIAVSQSLGQQLSELGYAPQQVTVVPNGVPAPELMRGGRPPGREWTVGTVALFRPRKGLEVLLEALSMLRHWQVPVRLRAVGPFESADYERRIKEAVEAKGLGEMIAWKGFTEDVPAELVGMDLFVLPSLFGEGLPMVVLEAMAAGVPVLASRVEGIPEAIQHGESGLLVPPGNALKLAESIRSLVDGDYDWSSIRRQAIRRHGESFSDQTMAAGVAAVYRRLTVEA